MNKHLGVILFFIILLASSTVGAERLFLDKKGNEFCFDWVAAGDLHEEEQLFIQVFKELYKDVPEVYFGSEGLVAMLQRIFDEEKAKHNFISVKKDDDVVGFVSFRETERDHEIYLKLIAVDPAYRQCGIGKELILSILRELPNTEKFVLDTRKTNKVVISFCKEFGFKSRACFDKTLPQEWYIGFEVEVYDILTKIGHLFEV